MTHYNSTLSAQESIDQHNHPLQAHTAPWLYYSKANTTEGQALPSTDVLTLHNDNNIG